MKVWHLKLIFLLFVFTSCEEQVKENLPNFQLRDKLQGTWIAKEEPILPDSIFLTIIVKEDTLFFLDSVVYSNSKAIMRTSRIPAEFLYYANTDPVPQLQGSSEVRNWVKLHLGYMVTTTIEYALENGQYFFSKKDISLCIGCEVSSVDYWGVTFNSSSDISLLWLQSNWGVHNNFIKVQ